MELNRAAARPTLHPGFARIWEEECLPVTRVMFRGLSRQDADDATQEVALRLLKIYPKKVAEQADALAAGRSFAMKWPAYTTTTCQSVLADFYEDNADRLAAFGHLQSIEGYRATPSRPHFYRADDGFPDPLSDADFLPDPRATADPLVWVITADLSAVVRRTMAALPSVKRTVLAAHLDGATGKEASAAAGVPEATGYRYRRNSLHKLQLAVHAAGYGLDYPVTPPLKRQKRPPRHPEPSEGSVNPQAPPPPSS